jgi:phage-related protein
MTVPNRLCESCGRRVMERGDTYAIEAALDKDGVGQAGAFLDELAAGSDRQRDLVSDMLIRLETFARTGKLIVPRELNYLRGDLWEVKAGTLRLPFYYRKEASCGQVRLTHGFVKRSERTPRREMDRGEAIIREDQQR